MHAEAMAYLKSQLARLPVPERVLEIGSYDVNGSPRYLFPRDVQYVGLDRRPGNGVDIAADARDYDGRESFDLVITAEAMEHDAEPRVIIECAWRALRPGGWLLATAAAPERPPHNDDGNVPEPGDTYHPVAPDELARWLVGWENVEIVHDERAGDVRARAQKPA